MPEIVVNGLQLYYQSAGTGESVVFVHGGFAGLRGASSLFDQETEAWDWTWESDFAREFRFTWYDRRGCYHSSRPPNDDYSLEMQARDLAALLDHLQIARTHLIGSSAGGPISVLFSATRPGRVRSLILAGTALDLFPRGEPVSDLIREQIRVLDREGPDAAYARRSTGVEDNLDLLWEIEEAKARGNLAEYLEEQQELTARAQALPRPTRVRWYATALHNIKGYLDVDLARLARQVRAPTLVLHGTADRMVPPALGEALARAIPSARFQLIAGGPHGVIHRSDEGRQTAVDFIKSQLPG